MSYGWRAAGRACTIKGRAGLSCHIDWASPVIDMKAETKGA